MSSAAACSCMIDRGDYWQCAFLIPKGAAEAYQARGIDAIREEVAAAAPELDLGELDEISDLHLLTVKLDRLTRWHRPGLLAIGDAAHAMSPIGGIGINLAIQDAVAAANFLAGAAGAGRRRRSAARQGAARAGCSRPASSRPSRRRPRTGHRPAAAAGRADPPGAAVVRLLDRFPLLRRIPGRFIGLGVRREQWSRSPDAGAQALRHRLLQVGADRLEELLGRHPALLGADQDREVLGHLAALDGLDADPLERLGEAGRPRACRRTCRGYLRPPVQAKIEAIGLVEVALPCWCMR